MCGITGVVRFDGQPPKRELIERMCKAIAHRGPDGEGVLLQGPAGLGHRRLAIIDLAGGAQPMSSADGKLAIVYNGELYNFRELAAELKSRGHQFRTSSDTEVILYAWREWGDDCVKRFRGMFAFCAIDFEQRRWLLARDHFGIKPVLYRLEKDSLAFASEFAALRELEGPLTGSLAALEWFMRFQYIPAPDTVFNEIRKLEPAHVLSGDFDGKVNGPRRYWQMSFSADEAQSESQWLEQLDNVMRESVKAHLISDVPVGVFISGGIDSTAIATQMQGLVGQQVKAFSIGFDEASVSELPYAEQVAKKLGVEHHTLIVREDFWGDLPKLVSHYGEPFGDNSAIPTWQLAKLTRSHVKVALSGDGGDEGFAGYSWYGDWLKKPRLRDYTRRLRRGFSGENVGSLAWAIGRKLGAQSPRLSEWQRVVQYTSEERRRALYGPKLAKLANCANPGFAGADAAAPRDDMLAYAQFMDWHTYIHGAVLAKVDVATMYHGVEARTPLIDLRVLELALRLPISMRGRIKDDGSYSGKYLLKKWLESRFPPEFVYRKKQGFGIPRKQWFLPGRPGRKLAEQVLTDRKSRLAEFFAEGAIGDVLAQHSENKDRSSSIWLMLVLGIWLDQNRGISFA